MNKALNLAGRILLAQIFIISGFSKIGGYAGTQAYMASVGLPGALLPLVIALELLGGLALIVGIKTRWVAFALAGFSVVSALIFHSHFRRSDATYQLHEEPRDCRRPVVAGTNRCTGV